MHLMYGLYCYFLKYDFKIYNILIPFIAEIHTLPSSISCNVNCYLFYVEFYFLHKVLEGRAYRLMHPWVGIVNRSQAEINKNVDMTTARQKEIEYFQSSPEYGHLSHKMGSEYLAKLLSEVCESTIGIYMFILQSYIVLLISYDL